MVPHAWLIRSVYLDELWFKITPVIFMYKIMRQRLITLFETPFLLY